MIVYFTGTGNSRYCADYLANALGDETVNAFDYIRNGIAAELISDKPWVFVAPTYAWRLPVVFSEFIEGGSFSGSHDAYFVMTCGSEIGNPMKRNATICQRKGLNYRGTYQVVMPENYIALFDAPDEKQAKRIVNIARRPLRAAAECISSRRDFPEHRCKPTDALNTAVTNPIFRRFIVSAKKFTVSDSCISCGKCEGGCVTKNITMENGKPLWGKNCIHCMACICACPAKAIEYGTASLGKPRYQCPDYEVK